ncbi:MAG TPA: twin-arginine translocase TatA/TatE family subunit [Solirubrobacterales bacterium]|jgi:sec-independent protein translocase protein TatA|nr:twin-arginine translocase TatA/TatE family subunit [Solirubrobacterales bacterium]
MPNIGPLEIAIVAIIALVIFGPKRLPELGSSLGRGMREFKSSITGEDKENPEIENGFEDPAPEDRIPNRAGATFADSD